MPGGSTDDRPLADALVGAGVRVRLAVWNDRDIDWSSSARTVIRSTWDYHLDPDAWFAWLARVAPVTRLINDAAVLRWNSDKRYLLDLQAAGVAIVPTEHVSRGDRLDLRGCCAARGWTDIVVKPAIGARRAPSASPAAIGERAQAHQRLSRLRPDLGRADRAAARHAVRLHSARAGVRDYPRFTMVGGDAETVRGDWTIRGEMAITTGDTVVTGTSPLGLDGHSLRAGVGADRKAGAYRLSGTVLVEHRVADADPALGVDGVADTNVSLVVGGERGFARDTRKVKVFGAWNVADASGFARTIGSWSVRDNLSLEGTVGWFFGEGDDTISRFADRDFVAVSLKTYF